MSASHRKNLKVTAADFAHLERAAGEDGDPSATAYVRKLIAADRIARARAEAQTMLAEIYERHPGAPIGPSDTEFLRTAVRLYEFMTGTVPPVPAGVRPHEGTRLVLAQIAARAIVDGAELECVTGDDLALGAFITTIAQDPRVTLASMRGVPSAIGNIINALIDLLGERALAEAAH